MLASSISLSVQSLNIVHVYYNFEQKKADLHHHIITPDNLLYLHVVCSLVYVGK